MCVTGVQNQEGTPRCSPAVTSEWGVREGTEVMSFSPTLIWAPPNLKPWVTEVNNPESGAARGPRAGSLVRRRAPGRVGPQVYRRDKRPFHLGEGRNRAQPRGWGNPPSEARCQRTLALWFQLPETADGPSASTWPDQLAGEQPLVQAITRARAQPRHLRGNPQLGPPGAPRTHRALSVRRALGA